MRTSICRNLLAIIALAFASLAVAQESQLSQSILQLNQQVTVTRPTRGSNYAAKQQRLESTLNNRQALV